MAEGVTVGLLDRAADRRADMREEQRGTDVARDLAEVAVVPGRFGAVEDARRIGSAIPPHAEAVAVGRLGAEPRVEALTDERVGALVERLSDEHGGPGVCEPAAHSPRLSVGFARLTARSRHADPARGTRRRALRAGCSSIPGARESSEPGDARPSRWQASVSTQSARADGGTRTPDPIITSPC